MFVLILTLFNFHCFGDDSCYTYYEQKTLNVHFPNKSKEQVQSDSLINTDVLEYNDWLIPVHSANPWLDKIQTHRRNKVGTPVLTPTPLIKAVATAGELQEDKDKDLHKTISSKLVEIDEKLKSIVKNVEPQSLVKTIRDGFIVNSLWSLLTGHSGLGSSIGLIVSVLGILISFLKLLLFVINFSKNSDNDNQNKHQSLNFGIALVLFSSSLILGFVVLHKSPQSTPIEIINLENQMHDLQVTITSVIQEPETIKVPNELVMSITSFLETQKKIVDKIDTTHNEMISDIKHLIKWSMIIVIILFGILTIILTIILKPHLLPRRS